MKLHKPRDYKRQFTVCAYMRDIDSNYLPVAKTFGHFSRPLKNFLKTFKDVSKIFLTIHKSLAVRKLVQIPPLLGALLTASRDYQRDRKQMRQTHLSLSSGRTVWSNRAARFNSIQFNFIAQSHLHVTMQKNNGQVV